MRSANGSNGLADMLERVAAVEAEIRPLAGHPAPLRRFRRLGAWLVDERFLLDLCLGWGRTAVSPVPARLSRLGLAPVLGALALPPRLRARCHAHALLAKTHVRAFYAGPPPFSVKVVLPEARDAVLREVEARHGAGHPATPNVLSHRIDGPHPHLCEEFVFGRHPQPARDADALLEFVLGDLWASYEKNGFEWRPAIESHDLDALLANFEEVTEAIPWPPAWPARDALRGDLLRLQDEAHRLVPWCHGHGDLSLGNMLICDGRIHLLDWERTRPLTLLHELAKIVVTVPGSWEQVAKRVQERFRNAPAPGMLPPPSQALLASLERLAELRVRFAAQAPGAVASPREASRFARRLRGELAHMLNVRYADAY